MLYLPFIEKSVCSYQASGELGGLGLEDLRRGDAGAHQGRDGWVNSDECQCLLPLR